MYGTAVPMNKLQQRLHSAAQEALAPGTGVRHTALGSLVEVYDQETLALMKPDKALQAELDANPGLLFAKVLMANGKTIVLPFKEPEDQIFLTYGNAKQLQGRLVKVEYEGLSVENGQIIVQRTFSKKQINVAKECHTLDIGNIV